MKREVDTDDCWLYAGRLSTNGYGVLLNHRVHRLTYEKFVGQIPDDLEIDHLCEVKPCINPDHLEAVTHLENARRGNMKRRNELCRKGLHVLSGSNLLTRQRGTTLERSCKQCKSDYSKRTYEERKLTSNKSKDT